MHHVIANHLPAGGGRLEMMRSDHVMRAWMKCKMWCQRVSRCVGVCVEIKRTLTAVPSFSTDSACVKSPVAMSNGCGGE